MQSVYGHSALSRHTVWMWRREMLERSTSAQCPSVAYQLAGAKKVQQDLAAPGALERFLEEPRQAELLRACFAGKACPLAGCPLPCCHRMCCGQKYSCCWLKSFQLWGSLGMCDPG